MIDEKPDRQLRGHRDDVADGQRQTQFNKADAEMFRQKWKKRRQHQVLIMLDEMRRRNDTNRPRLAPAVVAAGAAHFLGATEGSRFARHRRSASRDPIVSKIEAHALSRQAAVWQS